MEKNLIEVINYYEDLVYDNQDSFAKHFNIKGLLVELSFDSSHVHIVYLPDNAPTLKNTIQLKPFFSWAKGLNKDE